MSPWRQLQRRDRQQRQPVGSGWVGLTTLRCALLKAVIESTSFNAVSRTLAAYFSVIDSRRRLKAPPSADRSRFLLSKSRPTRSDGRSTAVSVPSFAPAFLPVLAVLSLAAVFVDEWWGNRLRQCGIWWHGGRLHIRIRCYIIFGILALYAAI